MQILRWGLSALLLSGSPILAAEAGDVESELKALRADVDALKAAKPAGASASSTKVWTQITGYYNNTVGAGDGADGVPKNRSTASSIVDLGLEGDPAEGLHANLVLRLDKGTPGAFDIWAEQSLPLGLSLRAGFLDLTGIFDASAIANDEKSQFIRSEFVDSPVLGQGSNGGGLRLLWQADESLYVQVAVQDLKAKNVDPFDELFSIVEAGYKHGLLGGGELKAWAREKGRGFKGAVPAVGVVVDQAVVEGLSAFLRWGQEFTATGMEHDDHDAYTAGPLNGGGVSGSAPFSSVSAGLDWKAPMASRPDDHVAAAWGTVRAQDTSSWDFVEAYYSWSLSENAQLSLDYQGEFSRLRTAVTHDWDGDASIDSSTYVAADDEHKLVGRLNLAF